MACDDEPVLESFKRVMSTRSQRAQAWRRWRRRLGELASQYDFVLLLALVVVFALIWGFVEVADEVLEGETRSFDETVLVAVRNPDDPSKVIGPPFVTEMMRDVTALGGVAVITMITMAVAGFLLLARKRRALVAILLASLGGIIISQSLKSMFDRPRPGLVPHLAHVQTSSFPSGHSMLSAVVYLTLAAMLARLVDRPAARIYIVGVGVALTLAIGVSRVMLGVHYPTDVLAGWTVGAAWAVACWAVMRALQRRRAVERPPAERGRAKVTA